MKTIHRVVSRTRILLIAALSCLPFLVNAQSTDQDYRTPPLDIADIVDADPTPSVSVSPDKNWMLLMGRSGLPTIAELSQAELRIAGMRINPANNGTSRASYFNRLQLQDLSNSGTRTISGLPANPRIGSVSWSPDGEHIGFVCDRDSHIELWIADTATAEDR